MHAIGNWLFWITGSGGSGSLYGFWSGFGSDIGEVAIVGGLVAMARKHNCHVSGCWRIGKHPVDGTPFIVCRKHHPTVPPKGVTVEQVHQAHRVAGLQ